MYVFASGEYKIVLLDLKMCLLISDNVMPCLTSMACARFFNPLLAYTTDPCVDLHKKRLLFQNHPVNCTYFRSSSISQLCLALIKQSPCPWKSKKSLFLF